MTDEDTGVDGENTGVGGEDTAGDSEETSVNNVDIGFEEGSDPSAPETDKTYDLRNLGNIKSEWDATTIYLPAERKSAVELAYRRSSYECKRECGYDMQKLQDFYPLLIAMGLNNLNRSDSDDMLTLLAYVQSEYGADS